MEKWTETFNLMVCVDDITMSGFKLAYCILLTTKLLKNEDLELRTGI